MPPKAKEAPPTKEAVADAPIDGDQYDEALDTVPDDGGSGSDDDDAASFVSSASSDEEDSVERLKIAIGDPESGRCHVEHRRFLSRSWNDMLDKGIKEKMLSEDDVVAANTIVGLLRKTIQVQELMRADGYSPTDIHSLFRDEIEEACRWIAWTQFRAELPPAAAKTAYATVVAKRDRRAFKATKSGVVFVFDEQAKIYESYSKALLKAETSNSSKSASDRALDGKASAASANKALSEAKKELAKIKKEQEGLQRRNRAIEDAARQGGVSIPAGQAKERAANRARTRSTTAAGNGAAQE